MKGEYTELCIKDLYQNLPAISNDNMTEDIFLSKIQGEQHLPFLSHPCQFDGYFAYYCLKGHFSVELNLKQYEIQENSLLVYLAGTTIHSNSILEMRKAEGVLVAISRKVMADTHINLEHLFLNNSIAPIMANPCISLEEEEIKICRQYYELATSLTYQAGSKRREAIITLGQSIFNYLLGVWVEKMGELPESEASGKSLKIFNSFLNLLYEYHKHEHEVGFYAGKLNLTPKYLSRLVKEVSGQSAPKWIESMLIMEAKNYLKHTRMDIKEIVKKLNFSSSTVFHRYFKEHTKMTPSEYRKS